MPDTLLSETKEKTTIASLIPYRGEWTAATAAHLLRRTLPGPRLDEIQDAVQGGLNATVNELLQPQAPPFPPVLVDNENDPDVPIGSTWVNTPYTGSGSTRGQSLNAWFFKSLVETPLGIQAKMTVFWLNYFGMADVSDHRAMYSYIKLFQDFALGNFKELMEQITIHPAMLEFLDGKSNHRNNPNENYARELLELYTIQKGPLIGEGDYSTYTEQDVVAIARALTGWRNLNYLYSDQDIPVDSYFDPNWHDSGDKQLSYHFNNIVIRNQWENEYKAIIGVIFAQRETARAFCRELYRYFVFHEINAEVETNIINPLANILFQNDYDIAPVLQALFKSQHFYDMAVRGPVIKNPYEFMCSLLRPLGWYDHLPLSLKQEYSIGLRYEFLTRQLGMRYLEPPTVAGWEAYYDAPRYYRNWVSPSLLQQRFTVARQLLSKNNHVSNYLIPFNWYSFIQSLSNPLEVDEVLREIALIFLPREPHPEQYVALKESLLSGLPDMEWTLQCADYLANPNDTDVTIPLENRLRSLFLAFCGMAEFQLQ